MNAPAGRSSIPYQIKKTLTGKQRVLYRCPTCKTDLESSLDEAGSEDKCPRCGRPFVVPGLDETIAIAEAARKTEHQASERHRAEVEAKRKGDAREAERQRFEAEKGRTSVARQTNKIGVDVEGAEFMDDAAILVEIHRAEIESIRNAETERKNSRYIEISRSAHSVRDNASIIKVIGWLSILVGVINVIIAVVKLTDKEFDIGFPLLEIGLSSVVGGIFFIALTVLFELISHTCEAHRDLVIHQTLNKLESSQQESSQPKA